jgi:aminoglycoside phosphotransferase (APT) family kinase protein
MRALSAPFPDLHTLMVGLTSVLNAHGSTHGQVTILERQPNFPESTFPAEIVTCRLEDGSELRLFCKYTAGRSHNSSGHRSGVAYEAAVYQDVLQPLKTSVPVLYGCFTDVKTGETWLILEYLDKSLQLKNTDKLAVLSQAAAWSGKFHALSEACLSFALTPSLNKYDAEYYRGWARRTLLFAGRLHLRFPWLAALCERFDDVIPLLLNLPLTIIHGEYYAPNILWRDGVIYPVDWESTAIAVGEIDLAALTEGWWPPEIVQHCELAYQQVRWPEGAPVGFERRLDLARLYLHFRWLGDQPERTTAERRRWRFEKMRSVAERLGII